MANNRADWSIGLFAAGEATTAGLALTSWPDSWYETSLVAHPILWLGLVAVGTIGGTAVLVNRKDAKAQLDVIVATSCIMLALVAQWTAYGLTRLEFLRWPTYRRDFEFVFPHAFMFGASVLVGWWLLVTRERPRLTIAFSAGVLLWAAIYLLSRTNQPALHAAAAALVCAAILVPRINAEAWSASSRGLISVAIAAAIAAAAISTFGGADPVGTVFGSSAMAVGSSAMSLIRRRAKIGVRFAVRG